ncbi:MAG: glycogen debranching N-terminal domain-containing protein [Flavisolibacter sp.]
MIPQELINTDEHKFHIPADVVNYDDRVKVLNHFDTFAIFDRWGDVHPHGKKAQGIFHYGTRFINRLELRLNGKKPLLLSSAIKEENDVLSVDLTNPDITTCNIPENSLHLSRSQFLRNGVYYEELKFVNYGETACTFDVSFTFSADFRDIFEIRGIPRDVVTSKPVLTTNKHKICFDYQGLDNVKRRTEIDFEGVTDDVVLNRNQATIQVHLEPQEDHRFQYSIYFRTDEEFWGVENGSHVSMHDARKKLNEQLQSTRSLFAAVHTSNEQFNQWIDRSQADLLSLLTETEYGKYPYAGVPWYNTAFGRDGIITAMEVLWAAPAIARDVLNLLAAFQAKEMIPEKDAEPGKILHETRTGEMANTGEIPFREYYGTIDATPLFLMLAGMYYQRTADVKTIQRLWPNILAALKWIDEYGDLDGDGFVEYQHKAENGLTNQGWKDSHDSVMYEDGELAQPAIALCEVQGYVYAAKIYTAELAGVMGDENLCLQLQQQARELKQKFNSAFWDEEKKCFVLALDGDKNPCRVVSSNAGHCLYTGIADADKAKALAQTLMHKDMFTGWGIRTLSSDEKRYNPLSYHNGSIWPHDNALVAAGFSRYGYQEESLQVMKALFDASLYIEMQRLPELFCGFERRKGEGPTAYPVACSPQAWSVAAIYLLLESCLRMKIDAVKKQIVFDQPVLPAHLDKISIRGLRLGDETCDFDMHRNEFDVSFRVMRKPKDWEFISKK